MGEVGNTRNTAEEIRLVLPSLKHLSSTCQTLPSQTVAFPKDLRGKSVSRVACLPERANRQEQVLLPQKKLQDRPAGVLMFLKDDNKRHVCRNSRQQSVPADLS